MEPLFTVEAWLGGHHELELDLGPRSDERLVEALRALWAHPDLTGPFGERYREPAEQQVVEPDGGIEGHLFGVATLRDGDRVPCGSVATRYGGDEWPGVPQVDHLNFYVPRGGLEPFWPRYEASSEEWVRAHLALSDWFAGVGTSIYERVRFQAGFVGFELDAEPAGRDVGFLRPAAQGVDWDPPTSWDF